MPSGLVPDPDPAAGLVAAFGEIFGAPPEGVWSAPGRVNLIGEHTDYNGGLALPIALPQRTYAACRHRADGLLRVASRQQRPGEPPVEVALAEVAAGRPAGWAAYVAGVPWALREDGLATGGMDVLVDGQVPLGAGLSSSAALECAVGAAASDLFGLGLLEGDAARARLARACQRAENDIALAPTGGMDQSASLLCRPGHALLLDCRSGQTSHVPVALTEHGLELLVVDTRAAHALSDGQYGARRADCEQAAALLGVATLREIPPSELDAALATLVGSSGDAEHGARLARRVRHVVGEIQRVVDCVAALQENDFGEVGRLFRASHESLRDDYEVSCAELDAVVEECLAHGALGARMTGGGFGGSAIALVRDNDVKACTRAVRDRFAREGWNAPAAFTCVPSSPAHRDG